MSDLPQGGFAVPAREVLAVEERRKAVLGEDGQREGEQEEVQCFHGRGSGLEVLDGAVAVAMAVDLDAVALQEGEPEVAQRGALAL